MKNMGRAHESSRYPGSLRTFDPGAGLAIGAHMPFITASDVKGEQTRPRVIDAQEEDLGTRREEMNEEGGHGEEGREPLIPVPPRPFPPSNRTAREV
jgi:hypothetical protein